MLAELAGEGREPDTVMLDATDPCPASRAWPPLIDLLCTQRYMSVEERCEGEEGRDDGYW